MKFLKKIDKTEIVEKMTRAASKCGYKLKKASPTIMIVGAAIGGVTATVLACKATIKAQEYSDRAQCSGREHPHDHEADRER